MLDVTTEWDLPARALGGVSVHVLSVRIQTSADLAALPLHGVLLLDVSTSMGKDGKLDRAMEAIDALWGALRPGDRFRVLAFSQEVEPLLEWSEKGRTAAEQVRSAIRKAAPAGVTRLDRALEVGLADASSCPSGQPRCVWLVTDGHATDDKGHAVQDLAPLYARARAAADEGLVLGAIGLGDAAGFNRDFLDQLATHGKGVFRYAGQPETLATELVQDLAHATAISIPQAWIELSLDTGSNLTEAARIRPEYLALEVSPALGARRISLGPLARLTTMLLRVATATPLGAKPGTHAIGTLRIGFEAGKRTHHTEEEPIRLEYVAHNDPRARTRNAVADRERLEWDLARPIDPADPLRATRHKADVSRKLGRQDLADRYEADAAQILGGRPLSPHQVALRLHESRRRSGLDPTPSK